VISAVLFDLDETLFDRTTSLVAFLAYQNGRFADRLGEVTFEVWRDRFLALDARGYVHKSLVYLALLAEFSGDLTAVDALLDDYREHCCEHARGSPGMAATLMTLRSYGLRLGIVTNGETEFQTRHVDALGLTALVDAVLISEAEGLRKPDAALFRRAADRLHVALPECLFVGDNPAVDVLGAHAAGMRTAWFRCGAVWPSNLAPMPGLEIDTLDQVLDLIGIDAS
jgi:putative hydrolase of the HAD superfamily